MPSANASQSCRLSTTSLCWGFWFQFNLIIFNLQSTNGQAEKIQRFRWTYAETCWSSVHIPVFVEIFFKVGPLQTAEDPKDKSEAAAPPGSQSIRLLVTPRFLPKAALTVAYTLSFLLFAPMRVATSDSIQHPETWKSSQSGSLFRRVGHDVNMFHHVPMADGIRWLTQLILADITCTSLA